MTTPAEQKKMILEVYEALLKSGKIVEKQEFWKPLGIKASYGSNILNPDSNNNFPKNRVGMLFSEWNVNPDWWYHKKGDMFLRSSGNRNVAENETNVTYNNPNKSDIANPDLLKVVSVGGRRDDRLRQIERNLIAIPIVEKRAQAGYALDYADPEYLEHLPKIYVSKEFERGNYVAFEISGDSMDDDKRHAICDGDVVLTKELSRDLWRDKLHFGKYLFVIVYDDGCVIKQITGHNQETGDITCHSFNPFYDDYKINLKDVYQLLYVVKVVDRTVRI